MLSVSPPPPGPVDPDCPQAEAASKKARMIGFTLPLYPKSIERGGVRDFAEPNPPNLEWSLAGSSG